MHSYQYHAHKPSLAVLGGPEAVLLEHHQQVAVPLEDLLLEEGHLLVVEPVLDDLGGDLGLWLHDWLGLEVVDMGVLVLEEAFGLLGVEAGGVVLEALGVVDVVDVEHAVDVLAHHLEHLLEGSEGGLGLLLHLEDDLLLEDEVGVEEGLRVDDELPADAAPHVVGGVVVVVDVEDVPALHEGRVLGQQRVLHVLEVVLRHLVVHLVLEALQVPHELVLPVQRLQPLEQVLPRLLPVLPRPQEGEGHVLAGRSGVEDHHLDGRQIALQLALHPQQDGLLVGLGQVEADVEVVLLLAVGLLEEVHYLLPGTLYLRPGADDGDLLVLLLDVVEGVVDLPEGRLPADAELCDTGLALEGGDVVDDGLDLVGIEVQPLHLESPQAGLDLLVGPDDVVPSALEQHATGDFQWIALFVDEGPVVVDGDLGGLLHRVDEGVAGAEQSAQEDGRHLDVGLCDAHLHLQLVDDLVADVHDALEHADLVLVADHHRLRVLEEVVRRVAPAVVEVYLRAYLLQQDEVVLEHQHLHLVEVQRLLLVLTPLSTSPEVCDLLDELRVLLQVHLELVHRLLGGLVVFVLLPVGRRHPLGHQVLLPLRLLRRLQHPLLRHLLRSDRFLLGLLLLLVLEHLLGHLPLLLLHEVVYLLVLLVVGHVL